MQLIVKRTRMKLLIPFVLGVVGVVLLGSQDKPKASKDLYKDPYEFKMISSGDNRPAVNLMQDSLHAMLTLLHQGSSETNAMRALGWGKLRFDARKKKLIENDFLKAKDGKLRPNVMIISIAEGQQMERRLEPMAAATAALIKAKLPFIEQHYQQIPAFRNRTFSESSLLILSDVLLDNWQIREVEQGFLKKERPLRHGKRYYAALMQKRANSPVEALGIYGNNVTGRDGYAVCRYGNVRYTPEALQQTQLVEQAYQRYKAAGSAGNSFAYPVLTSIDEAALSGLAGLIRPELLALLEKNRPKLEEEYRSSPYVQEVSFEEYFIWWYHVFYTRVTNKLLAEKIIVLPPSQLAFYVSEE